MKVILFITFLTLLLCGSAESGSVCPSGKSLYPCFCTNLFDGLTIVICPGIQNTSHLEEVTNPLKSLIVDRFLLLNTFSENGEPNVLENAIDPKTKIPSVPLTGMLPKKWLSELRVRDLEIQTASFNEYFLTDDAFEGQSDFLTSLVAKNANLRGHLCSSCSPSLGYVSTKALRRVPLLKNVDFSHNHLEVVDGVAFPSTLKELNKINLSNNHINRVNDNAFGNLQQLNHLDLSRNRITAIGRKIFRNQDTALASIDLSYNSIQALPEDMFVSLNGLKDVKLSHNLLETLPAITWTRIPALLEKIDLRGNFLVCNCTMDWIPRRLSKSTKLVGQCVAPKTVEFQDVKPTLPTLTVCRGQ